MSRESYIAGFSKVATAHGFNPQHLANYVYAREMNKVANWFTDAYTKWRTNREIKKSDEWRRERGLKPFNRSIPAARPGVYPIKNDHLARLAQDYSDKYKPGLAKPKVVSGGKIVAM